MNAPIKPKNFVALRKVNEVVEISGRQRLAKPRWTTASIADWILANALDDWEEVAEIARFVYGTAYQHNQDKARKNLNKVFKELLGRGFVMLTEVPDGERRISRVKIYDPKSEADRQMVLEKIKKMSLRSHITAAQYDAVMAILTVEK